MYQSIGINSVVKITSCIAIAILILLVLTTFDNSDIAALELLKKASASISATVTIIAVLGQTPIFPQICKLPLVRTFFPPIDGEWAVSLESNWENLQENENIDSKSNKEPTTGKIKIKARFLSVDITFQSDNKYSHSDTVAVGVDRESTHSTITLNYIYENRTPVPVSTDSFIHNGAARVTLDEDPNGEMIMTGTYWTDRQWTEKMNTAGRIKLKKLN